MFMAWKDLREFLLFLEEKYELKKISREVNPKHEVGAAIRKTSNITGPALLFETVKGYDIPVLGGLYAKRERVIHALKSSPEKVHEDFIRGANNPIDPKITDSGVCQEVVWRGDQINLRKLPICIHHPKDNSNPYITAGVQIARDSEYGRNASISRCMVLDEKRLTIYTEPPKHLGMFHVRAEKRGEPLDLAIAIGVDPVFPVASQIRARLGVDETTLAGGLRGQPVELTKCLTVDAEAPSTSEIVIEGRLMPNIREREGPLAEYTGYYGPPTESPVMEVTAITMREKPLYHTALTGKPPTENHLMKQIPLEASLRSHLKNVCPNVKAVHFTSGGGCQNHAIISIKQTYAGEAKTVILAAFSSNTYVKHVVVVDDDIDVFNLTEVEWAIAFRFQANKDLYVFPEVVGGVLDPSAPQEKNGVITSGLGIDATRPYGQPYPEAVEFPEVEKISLE